MRIRDQKLHHNFRLMFWIKALTEVKVINVVSTLFFLHRGLTLSNIFFTAIVYSLVTIISEVPSSYLADKFGRKKVIIWSVVFCLGYWILNIFAKTFNEFIFAFILLSFSTALLSGTDEALVYDTSRELKEENKTLKKLGQLYSAQRIFKIIVPIIAVLIARNLNNEQFISLLLIDVLANMFALFLSTQLVEPKRHIKLEKIEAGVIVDSINLFKKNPSVLNIMLNKSILFIAIFMLWRISSDFFVGIGVPLLMVGLITAFYQAIIYFFTSRIDNFFPMQSLYQKIDFLNVIAVSFLAVFLVNYLTIKSTLLFLVCFVVAMSAETIRWPIFSELIHKLSSSYNRATTISLSNFLKSILDIPLLFAGSFLINLGYVYIFILIFILSLLSPLLFSRHASLD